MENTNSDDVLADVCKTLSLPGSPHDNKRELAETIKTAVMQLQYQLAEARLKALTNQRSQQQEIDELRSSLNTHRGATKVVGASLAELVGFQVNTDDPRDIQSVVNKLQFQLADAKLNSRNDDALQKRVAELALENQRLQNKLGDANLTLVRLKQAISDTLGTLHSDNKDLTNTLVLFWKLQNRMADERLELLTEQVARTQYELAEERLQTMHLRGAVQTMLSLNVEALDDAQEVRQLMLSLQQQLRENYGDVAQENRADASAVSSNTMCETVWEQSPDL